MTYVTRLTGAFRRFASAKDSGWDVPLVVVASLLLYVPFLGAAPVFDTDEANFAAASREMLWRSDYLRVTIGLQPFFDKPPLFLWLQAMSMHLFGVTEWAARLPNAIIGAITYALLFRIGMRIWNRRFAYFWVLAHVGSILPSVYFRSGIIDPLFNLLMFSAIWNIIQCQDDAETTGDRSGNLRAIVAGVFSGLAVLAKGPLGYGIPVLCWFLFWALIQAQLSRAAQARDDFYDRGHHYRFIVVRP